MSITSSIPNNYKPNFEIIESKQAQINKLKIAIKKANEVILATDDDRESEAIAWHIATVFNLDVFTTKRIIFHEITEKDWFEYKAPQKGNKRRGKRN